MTKFTLATLATPDGPKAAVGVAGKYYLLEAVQPLLRDVTCKTVLENWDRSLPLLEHLAGQLSDGGEEHPADIAAEAANLLTPVCIPMAYSR